MDCRSTEIDRTNGRWTKREHQQFLIGLQLHGKNWKKIESMIVTRNGSQIRSHAQKYFLKGTQKSSKQRQGTENESPSQTQNSKENRLQKLKSGYKNTLELNSPDFWHQLSQLTSLPEFCFWNLIDKCEGKQTAGFGNPKSFEKFRKEDKERCLSELTNICKESGDKIKI